MLVPSTLMKHLTDSFSSQRTTTKNSSPEFAFTHDTDDTSPYSRSSSRESRIDERERRNRKRGIFLVRIESHAKKKPFFFESESFGTKKLETTMSLSMINEIRDALRAAASAHEEVPQPVEEWFVDNPSHKNHISYVSIAHQADSAYEKWLTLDPRINFNATMKTKLIEWISSVSDEELKERLEETFDGVDADSRNELSSSPSSNAFHCRPGFTFHST